MVLDVFYFLLLPAFPKPCVMVQAGVGKTASGKPQKKGIKFAESVEDRPEDDDTELRPQQRKIPKRHTGYAFDHPGFESFHADEVNKLLKNAHLHSQLSPAISSYSYTAALAVCPAVSLGSCKVRLYLGRRYTNTVQCLILGAHHHKALHYFSGHDQEKACKSTRMILAQVRAETCLVNLQNPE